MCSLLQKAQKGCCLESRSFPLLLFVHRALFQRKTPLLQNPYPFLYAVQERAEKGLLEKAHGTMPSAVKKALKKSKTYRAYLYVHDKKIKKEEYVCLSRD